MGNTRELAKKGSDEMRMSQSIGLGLALVFAISGASLALAAEPEKTAPTVGARAAIFALLDPGEPADRIEHFARLDVVDGLAFRARWRALEPRPGLYDWRSLDAALEIAGDSSKLITLHVAAEAPPWLSGEGARMYAFTSPIRSASAPIPWDDIYLARYTRFLAALADHVRARGDEGRLHAVSVGAPVSEMSILGCRQGWLAPGEIYDRDMYLQAWKTSFDGHLAAFPMTRLYVSAPVAVICLPDQDGLAFYRDLMSYALDRSATVAVFVADLNARGSRRLHQVDPSILTKTNLGVQTIWSSTDDPTGRMEGSLLQAVCAGRRSGARYFEIYKSDLLSTDPDVRAAVAAARDGAGC